MHESEPERELSRLRLIKRAVELRRTRRIAPVWIDEDQVSIARSEFDVGVRQWISWENFELLITYAERYADNGAGWNAGELVVRKQAGRVEGVELQVEEKVG